MSHPLASGIISAPVLPFAENGAIDWAMLDRYIVQVAAGKPQAIAMNMAVSEVSSLEIAEQLEVIRRCKAVLAGSCTLLSGLSVTHTVAAREHSKRLVDAGAEGIVAFPPVPAFLGGATVEMIEDWHRAIAEAIDVPILAFQTPFSPYPKGAITALSGIPSIVSIKDASFNVDQTLANVEEAAAAPRRIGVLTGSDTFILEAMLMGCDGALIGFAATATAALVSMQAFAQQGKVTEAYEIWNQLGPLVRVCWRQPLRDYRVRTKYVLMRQGVLPNMVVRSPFPKLHPQDQADIDKLFNQYDLMNPRFLPAGRATADGSGGARSAR
ncbi:MAG: dihydrodipicolinate synthase family protein [Betaproteobacteria bacterium]